MAFRSARLVLALGLLVGAARGTHGQLQPPTRMQGQPTPMQGQPAPMQRQPTMQGQPAPMPGQPGGGQAQHLGRTYPRQLPPPPPRKSPRVYVSIIPPRQPSNVFQHIGRSNGTRGAGGVGNAGGMGNAGGTSGGFPAR